ncbi:MAG: molybdate ABC transporter permease subunit [Nitrospinota bacterium]
MAWWQLSEAELEAIRLTLLVAFAAVAGSLPFGIGLGWLLARRDFPGKTALETALSLPLVLPPVVTGYLLLVSLGRNGWLGRYLEQWFGLRLIFTWKAAALAAAVIAFPLMVRAIRLAFAAVDPRLESTARTLGAGPLGTFAAVTLPLAWQGILAGSILSFARSLGEFGATIMIAGNIPGETRTISLYIFTLIESPGGIQEAGRMVVASILIAAAAMAAGEFMERKYHPAERREEGP